MQVTGGELAIYYPKEKQLEVVGMGTAAANKETFIIPDYQIWANKSSKYTKPTRQGTGLGLSLSYDIVKAHGGEIKVNTKVEESLIGEDTVTEFTIQLPI